MYKKILLPVISLVLMQAGAVNANQHVKDARSVPHVLTCPVVSNLGSQYLVVYYLEMVFDSAVVYRPPQKAGQDVQQDRKITFNLPDGSFNSMALSSDFPSGFTPNITSSDCADGRTLFELEADGLAYDIF